MELETLNCASTPRRKQQFLISVFPSHYSTLDPEADFYQEDFLPILLKPEKSLSAPGELQENTELEIISAGFIKNSPVTTT